ncbi:MAG: aminotransferase class I/II-fold pyridoxal phosphate-dependent enzyme [Prevotella sp.]|nr:aminotransferase class I/II-fold pyridoxal phosphate-dependent enzyme [Prevotella sp.]
MIEGHGDDAYHYDGIRSDFSSNICTATSHRSLMTHLAAYPELLAHYPEPEAWSLECILARQLGISPKCVIVTSGATEAIYLIAQTFRYKAVIPTPTFSEYEDACRCFEDKEDRTMLWLCNPNNPDGHVYSPADIGRMADEHDLVVLDQSYEHYTDHAVMSPAEAVRLPHIIQIHSFTKTYAVPGLRLGYITAHENLSEALRCNLHPWSVSAVAIEAGKFLAEHDELACRPDLTETQRLRQRLMAIGIDVLPTQTNFMLCRINGSVTAADLKDYLARCHHLLIRDASNFRGLTPQHFRVAAQTPPENDDLTAAIQQFIQQSVTLRPKKHNFDNREA